MPTLQIDNITVTVPDGTSILEAAKTVRIWIPHFCYHPTLGKAGACRVCAVKLIDGPVKGIQMSCMLPAQDGMVVSTSDPEALAMRAQVIEWLMTNHPHDCPVCDEGGECLLQDYTIAGGHGIRRFNGRKRTHVNQDLGPHIQHEMNRCIQCYRCARFYQDYAGGSDFGVLGSARRVYFGRFADGALQSPFSGNLVDLCPTGVFTDKTARFRARYWDYEMAPSICPHCSLGCNTVPIARFRELLKVVGQDNPAVNGPFICDRGRFGNDAVNQPTRPRLPLVDGHETVWDEALDIVAERIWAVMESAGPTGLALVGSARMSLEGAIWLAELARALGVPLCFDLDQESADRNQAAVQALQQGTAASLANVRNADCIAIVEADLRDEGPMMLLAVRQAWRSGAPVFLIGNQSPLEQAQDLSIEAIQLSYPEEVPFGIFERPVIICSTRHNDAASIATIAHGDAAIAILLAGPNSFGTAVLAAEYGAVPLRETLATGTVQALVTVETDLPPDMPPGIAIIAAIDWQHTLELPRAEIVLPTTAWTEMDGTYINNEGRAQRFKGVMAPGLPIRGLPARYHAAADKPAPFHPPRIFRTTPPGGAPLPAWQVLARLRTRLTGETDIEPLTGRWAVLRDVDPAGEGICIGELPL
jgi:NADH-quinone oxidoreductase subunit G